jgi:hypothetical protein
MAFNHNPSTVSINVADQHNFTDYERAPVGKWFIGIVETTTGRLWMVPVNIQSADGVSQNASLRGMNRYASGSPEEARAITGTDPTQYSVFPRGNWMDATVARTLRPHHHAICLHYGVRYTECAGFTLIKLAPRFFAQLKFGSFSLHDDLHDRVVGRSFSAQTFNRTAYEPGTPQMPAAWRRALIRFFHGYPFVLPRLASSDE